MRGLISMKWLIAGMIFVLCNRAFCQSGAFSESREQFIRELSQLLNDTKRDDCKQAAQQLAQAWPQLGNVVQGDLIEVAKLMQSRRMLAHPYFYKLALAALAYQKNDPGSHSWSSWYEVAIEVLKNLRQGNNKQFDEFLDFSIGLFENQTLHRTASKAWKFRGGTYDLRMDGGQPVLVVSDCDLIGWSPADSTQVYGTEGLYYPLDQRWIGKGGRVDWRRAGFEPDAVFVELRHYRIDMRKSEYAADSARLNYENYRKAILYGVFRDKIFSTIDTERVSYPQFISYRTNLMFDDLMAHVRLRGGLELAGSRMAVYGRPDSPAVMRIYRFDDQLGVLARAQRFAVRKGEVHAAKAYVKIFYGRDSLVHQGINLRYWAEQRELFLTRGTYGIFKSPFYDYYRKLELSPELVYWNLGEPELVLRNVAVTGQSTLVVESFDYFRAGRMDKYQGLADYNLVERLKQIVDRTGLHSFYAEDLAKRIDPKYSLDIIEPMLYKLVEDGFIDYDDVKKIVTIRSKTFRYVAAKQKKVDYDNIRIESTTDGVNARVDMRSYEMKAEGVKSITLSDSSFVVVFPRDGKITLGQNRNMDFSGSLFAGRVDMSGDGFSFDYAQFRLNLSHVDSMIINIPTGRRDASGEVIVGPIRSVISDLTGYVQIDHRENRSGIKPLKQYPILTTTQPSFVYYDHPSILGGVYERDKFYFQLDPFEFDSLQNFQWPQVAFRGKFVSDGIFPDLNETLRIQPDLSLGFRTRLAPTPLYGNRGTFSNEISLNNSGLRGKGEIRFVTARIKSSDIVFYPDSLLGRADSVRMDATVFNGREFPTVRGTRCRLRWLPYQDSMMMRSDTAAFRLFDLNTTLSGALILQSSGLTGRGVVDWAEATLSSNAIGFGKNTLQTDSCDFVIKSLEVKKAALKTTDVRARIDFDKRQGDFQLNDEESNTVFPYNQYSTTINEFRWHMDRKQLSFRAPKGSLADFVSLHPRQEGLSFQGTSAVYDLNDYVLRVAGVPAIDVVDSRFIPDSFKVVVEADAQLRTLRRARLLMDSVSQYHVFDSVTANIGGRNAVKASGRYRFVNATGQKQHFFCEDIGVFIDTTDGQKRLYARARIDSSQRLVLMPRIFFKGTAQITSSREPVVFKGFARLNTNHPKVVAEWFSVHQAVTPDSSYLSFRNPVNEYRRPMLCGLVFDADSNDLYVSFFNAKKSARDRSLLDVQGIVYYDSATAEFVAGDRGKLLHGHARGNVIRFQEKRGRVLGEGRLDFGFNFGLVKMGSAGSFSYDVNREEPTFRVALGLDFPMEDELLTYLANSVIKGNSEAEYADYTGDRFLRSMAELMTEEQEKRWKEQLNKTGFFVRSDELPYTIFLSDVELKWDKSTRSFYNTGPFAVAFIGKNSVATVVPGYIELGYKRTGDYFNLFLPAGDEEEYYFFFSYASNNLQVVSGERAFNQLLAEIKPEKRRFEEDGKIFFYTAGSENKKNTFVNRMKFLQEEAAKARKQQQQKK
ncbi:MAG: hypothetical protein NZL95_03530 [Chitinophagales bacterium]|nr:hypothetical protein [Chitinophagales bacterium]MDW8427601.1 hypothetical protein [Chitinophagales bacterium]